MTSKLQGNTAEVIQLYRYPGLAAAAATTLLHKVRLTGYRKGKLIASLFMTRGSSTLWECGRRQIQSRCVAACTIAASTVQAAHADVPASETMHKPPSAFSRVQYPSPLHFRHDFQSSQA